MSLTRSVLAAVVAGLLVPAGAQAATVSAAGGTIEFTAASREANALTVTGRDGAIRFHDSGVHSMTAGPGCVVSGAQRVDCAAAGIGRVSAELGDGDDSLSVQLLIGFDVYGGFGDDRIATFAGDDAVDGGPGDDTIETGWGDDAIDGGEGADSISGDYGRDRVVYSGRAVPLSVSLDDVADDGAAGEGDNVRPTVDDVTGGAAADTLTGDSGANQLRGGGGGDVLGGEGGDDTLDGGSGTDTFSGGAGIDTLNARDAAAEALACGSEADTAEADPHDLADADCESVTRDDAQAPPPTFLPVLPPAPTGGSGNLVEPAVATISGAPLSVSSAGVTAVRLKCPSQTFAGCAGTLVIETGREVRTRIGKRRFRIAAGRSATVPVRVDRGSWPADGRRTRRIRLTVTMETAGGTTTNTRVVKVKPAS